MYRTKRILAFIGARGGSKGLKNKNIIDLAGRPLISWTIEASLNSRYIDRTVVSTDSTKIASVARECGADVPFLRPKNLAKDDSPVEEAIRHAINWLKDQYGEVYDFVILLQTTSPLRDVKTVDAAIDYYFHKHRSPLDTLVSVVQAPRKMGWLLRSSGPGYVDFCFDIQRKNLNRQGLPTLYLPNGAFYLAPTSVLKKANFYSGRTIPYVMNDELSVDIDTREDLVKAAAQIKELRPRSKTARRRA
jgi:CMP-N-acetylneuraminic acid synthetase